MTEAENVGENCKKIEKREAQIWKIEWKSIFLPTKYKSITLFTHNKMTQEELTRMINEQEGALSLAFPALMRKVYLWMALALTITGFTSMIILSNESFIYTLFNNQLLFWGLVIGELILVFSLSARIHKMSITTATIMFVLYSVINGVTLAPLLFFYTKTSIAKVFFITAGTFGVMSLIGYTTKTDLSSIGKILFMALIGLIIATVVNLFMHSSTLDLIISYAGVVIFVGLTAWDTQKIKRMLAMCEEPDEQAHKIALMGSLALYLDFINLFIWLLRILGDRR
jgi:FtsH-binding integral membrane protein